jgi:predicted sugar kinase
MYLCVTNTVLLSIKINEVQDELRRFQRVLRLFDKIGAENFISGVGNRIFKDQVNKINNLLESDTAGLLLRSLSLSTNRKDISVITSHQLQKNGNP